MNIPQQGCSLAHVEDDLAALRAEVARLTALLRLTRSEAGPPGGRLRDECLNINEFWSLDHARVIITDWKTEYNQIRRHSSLGYQPPAVYAANCRHRN